MSWNTAPAARLTNVGADGFVSADDVLFLRRNVFQSGGVSSGEIDALFALAERAGDGDTEWPMFFEEAVADFYLREEEPQGYLTEQEVETLKRRVISDGRTASAIEIGALIKLVEMATRTPETMIEFVAEQLRRHIIGEEGAVREHGVDAAEAALLSRFIYAVGGCGNVGVSRIEAELLFDVNDAVARHDSAPEWNDLFKKAIANYLMGHFGYAPLERDEARRQHEFISDHSVSVGSFFKRMMGGGLEGFAGDGESILAERNRRRAEEIATAEQITIAEVDWLIARIGRDGALHDSERALIDYLRELEAELPPKLKALVDRAA